MNNPDHTATSLLHFALTRPLVLERLPWWGVLAALSGLAVGVSLPWSGTHMVGVAGLYLSVVFADWASLLLLPRLRRSYGPVNPPLIALSLSRAVLMLVIGLIGGWGRGALIAACTAQMSIWVLAAYALWIEPFRLEVVAQTLQSSKLDPAYPPIRVLHLADLHVERLTPREERLPRLIKELAPDLIVFSGDFVSLSYTDDPETSAIIRALVGEWQAPYGVFAVSGTPLVESQEKVAEFLKGTAVRWLRDEVVEIEVRGQRLALIGVTCTHHPPDDAVRMYRLARQAPVDCFRLLLFHAPDIAPQAARSGIDLFLCGHTHGGQWRVL